MSEVNPQADLPTSGERIHLEKPEEIASFRQPPGFIEVHKAKTAGHLAFIAFVAFFVMFLAHFISILMIVRNRPDAVEQVTRVFSTWAL